MSLENKNILIKAFLNLHEKMIGYGGKDDPYQGKSQQNFTAPKTTPETFRDKPVIQTKPTPTPVKPSTGNGVKAPGAIPIPKPKPDNLVPAAKPSAPIGSENSAAGSLSKDTFDRNNTYDGRNLNPAPTASEPAVPKEPLSLPNRTDIERSTLNAQDIADTKDNPSATRKKLDIARQKIQGTKDSTNEETMTNKLIDSFLKLQTQNPSNMFEAAKKVNRREQISATIDEASKYDSKPSDAHGIIQFNKPKTSGYVVGSTPDRAEMDSQSPHPKPKSSGSGYVVGSGVDRAEMDSQSPHKRIKESISVELRPTAKKDPNGELDAPSSGGKAPETTTKPDYPTSKPGPTRELKSSLPKGVTVKANEEVTFSEAELAHLAAILEGPVAPTDERNSADSSKATMSEEEAKVPKKRGRKPGVKVGAYGPRGGKKGDTAEGQATTNVSHPHPFHQIRSSRPDTDGNYTVTHEAGGKVHTAKVPAKAAAQFHANYLAAGKPAIKNAITDNFVSTHFPGVQKPKASGGISLPKIPSPKS